MGFEDGLPDHIIREAAMSEQQFQRKALRESRLCRERTTDALLVQRAYFHVNSVSLLTLLILMENLHKKTYIHVIKVEILRRLMFTDG